MFQEIILNEYQTLYQGDAREVLLQLPEASVDMIITSPPYWGLRKYDGEPVIWDGDECKHEWGNELTDREYHQTGATGRGSLTTTIHRAVSVSGFCLKCNAWLGQLGLEPTPELYIKHLCDIFDQCKRVLKKTGTLWINIDDSYAGGHRKSNPMNMKQRGSDIDYTPSRDTDDVSPKSLCAIPERFVLEMMNRGWIRRNTIIWHKGNPMPESVKDRFTVDFEYLYMFSQQGRYYFEQQFEPLAPSTIKRSQSPFYPDHWKAQMWRNEGIGEGRDAQTFNQQTFAKIASGEKVTANKRCVWEINTKPYKHAHFATFPPELVEIPIRAGCPEFVCSKCGKPREKIYKPTGEYTTQRWGKFSKTAEHIGVSPSSSLITKGVAIKDFTGYTDCGCGYYTCSNCGYVIDYKYDKRNEERIQSKETQGILSEKSREVSPNATEVGTLLPYMPSDISGKGKTGLLFTEVCREKTSVRGNTQPLPDRTSLSELQGRVNKQERLQSNNSGRQSPNGASGSNVSISKKGIITKRGSSSSQRKESGQQVGELGASNKKDAQWNSDVPPLSSVVQSKVTCPKCGNLMVFRHSEFKPGVVLDIFSGSGTVLEVALKLGRKSIGIDLSQKYCELTKKRKAQLGF